MKRQQHGWINARLYAYRFRLRKETAGGAWCPKRPIESGVREWMQVDLGGAHLVTAIEIQGRYDHGRGQEYTEEFTVEYWRPSFAEWRQYRLWDGKEVRCWLLT